MSNTFELIVENAIKSASERSDGKVDWANSPFQAVRAAGKNAVADFGEFCFKNYSDHIKDPATIIRKGHDIITKSNKKVEVKTSFKTKSGSYFFNQIYYEKDWDHLVFVFVEPKRLEMWICERPNNPDEHFRRNNGWSWQRSSSGKLDKTLWTKIYERNYD
jgi:hypothetical protein